MNNTYKVLIGLALVFSLIGWTLPNVDIFGGTTNYDSLQLKPARPADNALDVRNSTGTSKFIIDGSGAVIATGTMRISGAFTLGSTLGVAGAGTFSDTLDVIGETQLANVTAAGGELSMATSSTRFSTSTGTYTLTAADLCNSSIISVEDWDGSASSTVTLQLPTVTTLFADCLESLGKHRWSILVRNEASAAASTTLVVAGTNIVLTSSTNSGVTIAGGQSAELTMWRLNATATSSGVQVNVMYQSDAD